MARRLDNWIEEYLKYTEHSEAPDKFHYWTAVSTLAGALRRRVWLNMGYFQWAPNFFIYFVAPPGIVNKSTTGGIGIDLLRELGYINFGPSAGTWERLIEKMTECGEEFALPDGSYMPMTAITLVISELGTFIDPKNRTQIDVLVDLWDGKQGVWTKSTKTSGDENIVNPWVNILGFTTPSWIAENLSDYFSGGGFMSRSIFVYAEKKRKLVAYPSTHLPEDFLQRRQNLIHDLDDIASLCGEFKMTPTAYDWGEDWYERHYSSKHTHISSEKFAGYLARKQTHLHKVAMVVAASRSSDLQITEFDMIEAEKALYKIEVDMPKVFGHMNREKDTLLAAEVLAFIRKEKELPRQALYRNFMRTVGFDTFEKILRSLQQGGLIQTPVRDNVIFIVALQPKQKQED